MLSTVSNQPRRGPGTLSITTERLIHAPKQRVFASFLDFAGYPEWWPQRFRVSYSCLDEASPVGRRAEFSPGAGVRVGWELQSMTAGVSIAINYHRGPHTGQGLWVFEDCDARTTRARFSVSIQPKNYALALLYKVANVQRLHDRDIQELMAALDTWLGRSPSDL